MVFGATGQTGSVVAATLLENGLPVRVVLHANKAAATWQVRGAEVTLADVTDEEAVRRALAGATAAYLMNPPAYTVTDMFAQAEKVGHCYREAVTRAGAKKLVVLSSVGAQHRHGTGNIRTTSILENIFRVLEIPVTFLRAAWFMENWSGVASVAAHQGVLPSFLTPLERRIPMVAAEDIGRTAAEIMLEEWKGKRIIELHGPEDYSPQDVATAFAAVLGRPVRAAPVPESEWPPTLSRFGFSSEVVQDWCEMMRGFNAGHIVFEGQGIETRKGQITIAHAVRAIAMQQGLVSQG